MNSLFLKYIKSIVVISVLLLFLKPSITAAQDFSNRGKDFWVGYGAEITMYDNSNKMDMILYFTSDVTANVKVSVPGNPNWGNYVVPAGTVVSSAPIPKTGANACPLFVEGLSNKSIHITSDQSIVAYAHIVATGGSAATLLFPTNTLGRSYSALSIDQLSNDENGLSYCFVIATEDNTTVNITLPAGATTTTGLTGTFQKTMKKGDVFTMFGKKIGKDPTGKLFQNTDLTGTKIESVSNGPNSCKPIAVFSGSSKIAIQCLKCNPPFGTQSNMSSDPLFQQVLPQTAWGVRYLTVPTVSFPNNVIRVALLTPTYIVSTSTLLKV